MNLLLLSLYRILVIPVMVSCLPLAALFNRKLSAGLRLRRQKVEPLTSKEDPIWVHASSGEFEYAKAVVRELKRKHPEIPIVVTYFSPTFSKAAASFPGVDRALALPLDLPGPCSSFLRKFHPRLGLIARTDLWPEMLEQCRQRKIPVLLFSYTQKPVKSWLKKHFLRYTLHWIRQIYCVSPQDLSNLHALMPKVNGAVMGDTRYDQVEFRLKNPKALPSGIHPKGAIPCYVAGSTWPEDEAVLLPALSDLLLKNSLRLILVPHEPTPEHLASLAKQLDQLNLTYSLYSKANWEHEPVLLVDQVGVLAELYALGQFAFVGGSFRKSVHSVMEALGAGCITFVGPFHENNREAMEFKNLQVNGTLALATLSGASDLREQMNHWLSQRESLPKFSAELRSEFARRLGASERLVKEVEKLL